LPEVVEADPQMAAAEAEEVNYPLLKKLKKMKL
jgi:hypothetical protein